jgi:SAM-dependent methyltransferase
MIDSDEVTRLYDESAVQEWDRLTSRRVEFEITCRVLDEHLPAPPARILDVGAGPGRYALRLLERGYSVTIVDLSRECLALAEREAERRSLRFEKVVCGTATDLRGIPSSTFDAVLLLGPLYHLKSRIDREQTVREARRVVRPKGPIFSAFLNRYSVIRYAAKVRPAQLWEEPALFDSILDSGISDSKRSDARFLRTCYFADPQEIEPFMRHAGVDTVDIIGCEGVVAEVEERLSALPQTQLDPWIDLNYRLGRRRELLAAAAHILHVGSSGSSVVELLADL